MRIPWCTAQPAALALLIMISACDQQAELPVLGASEAGRGYTLSTGDQVRLTTFGEQSLSGEFGIDDSGYMALPLLGPVHAGGLTTRGLADKVALALKDRKLLASPNVVVEIVKYRPIFVLGEVQHPGPFPYQPHMTLLGAVALAGGFTPRAVKTRAVVVRTGQGDAVMGKLEALSGVEPGDVITVPERVF